MKTTKYIKLASGVLSTSVTALLFTACTGAGSGDLTITGPSVGAGSATVAITSVDGKTSSTWNAASGTVYIYSPTAATTTFAFAGTCTRGVDTVKLDVLNAAASAFNEALGAVSTRVTIEPAAIAPPAGNGGHTNGSQGGH